MVVIADDLDLEWTKRVLAKVQSYSIDSGFYVQKMMSRLHSYHLDDAPDLRSCNLVIRAVAGHEWTGNSVAISDPARLANFYGRENPPRVKYVREMKRLDYGKAHEDEYAFEMLEEN